MKRHLKATGVFFGITFFIAAIINVVVILMRPNATLRSLVTDVQTVALFILSVILFISGYFRILSWIQPIIMFALTPLPFMTTHESFYGLGFFVMGIVLLFRLGFFEKYRVLKLALSLAYLYVCEFVAAFSQKRSLLYTVTPLFVITVFLAFLYLAFREKIAVYLKEPKARFSLSERGLSGSESLYVMEVAKGRNVKEIASLHSVRDSTVRNSLSRAYHKLQIEDKAGIAALAEKYELVK